MVPTWQSMPARTDQGQQHDYRFDGLYQPLRDLAVYRWDWGHEHDVHLSLSERRNRFGWLLGPRRKRDGPVLLEAIVLTVGGGLLGFVIGWLLAGITATSCLTTFMPS